MKFETVMLVVAIANAVGIHVFVVSHVARVWAARLRANMERMARFQHGLKSAQHAYNDCSARLAKATARHLPGHVRPFGAECVETATSLLRAVSRSLARLDETQSFGEDHAEALLKTVTSQLEFVELTVSFRERRLPDYADSYTAAARETIRDAVRLRDLAFERICVSQEALGEHRFILDEEHIALTMLSNAFAALESVAESDPHAVIRSVSRHHTYIGRIAISAAVRVEAYHNVLDREPRIARATKRVLDRVAALRAKASIDDATRSLADAAVRASEGLTDAQAEYEEAKRLVFKPSAMVGRSVRTEKRMRRAMLKAGFACNRIEAIDTQVEMLQLFLSDPSDARQNLTH